MDTNSTKETNKKTEEKPERSLNEQRIRETTLIYYSRPDVRKAIFDFSKNRECVPRYFEGFGKRPDSFQYETDIIEFVKRGATSFHCSEELWSDPLEISTEFSKQDFDNLRIGWDLLLDVDSPYFEYSRIYAQLLIDALEFYGIKNLGIKFSGSKGLHIIVPWKAFPKEIYGQKTKDMFPEWPRIICQYLSELLNKKFAEKIMQETDLSEIAKLTGKERKNLVVNECKICGRPAEIRYLVTWFCRYCKNEVVMQEKTKRIPKCPDCRKEMVEKSRKEMLYCVFCAINSFKNPELFQKERVKSEEFTVADLILVSPRHLFRMPYSLHEKTSLSSVVIDKIELKNFEIKDAKPFKINIKNYYPTAKEEEAKNLLLSALDWKEQKDKELNQNKKEYEKISGVSEQQKSFENKELKKIVIPNPTENIIPPCINLILKGIKDDGRKRALFILINFFKSLGVSEADLEKRIDEWNQRNYSPLKKGYIQSQLIWYRKNQVLMPPNCNKSHYKDLNVCKPDELCRLIKNPVNYAVKKYFKNMK
ncbi:MAG: hypothetical protein PHF67_03585 [Candidatus Nanoarchaeia archaeon]|nr:hypothetical protein [Candidatus Nanoarchaeia archaeon]